MQRHVCGASSVHADHAQVIWSLWFNRAQAVDGGKSRNVQLIHQTSQLRYGARKLRACADQRDWALRLFH